MRMNTGEIIDNEINGYSLEEWKSFLEQDIKDMPNKLRFIEKMKDRMPESTYLEKIQRHNDNATAIQEDIDKINTMLNA